MDFKNPETIVIVQIGRIGDMILTTPLFSELKKVFPSAQIIVISSAVNKLIALNNVSAGKVIEFVKSPSGILSLFKLLFRKADIWIDTKDNYSRTSEYLVKSLKPKLSLGFNFEKKIFDADLKDFALCRHAVCLNVSPVNYLNKSAQLSLIRPSYGIPVSVSDKFNGLFDNKGKLNLVINISAGNESRYLSGEKWLEVIKKLSSNEKLKIHLIGLPKDRELIENLLTNCSDKKINYIKTSDIMETSEVVRKSDLVLTPDTSIVHICSAFNKPVIAVYPDLKWNLDKFRPLSDIHEVVLSKKQFDIKDTEADEIIEKVFKVAEML